MATTIKIKNSSVSGKAPAAGSLEVAELALNTADKKLFSKDANGNIFEIGTTVDSGDTLPGTGTNVGELFWDTDTETLYYWDGTQWQAIATGSGVEGEYLKLIGGNLTGDLTLGTDKVVLDATSGSATFDNGTASAEIIIDSRTTPRLQLTGSSTTSSVIQFTDESANSRFALNGDGSITADGYIQTPSGVGYDNGTGYCYIQGAESKKNAVISMKFDSAETTDSALLVFNKDDPTDKPIRLGYDGSITATGDVTTSALRTTNSNAVISETNVSQSGSIRLTAGDTGEYIPLNITNSAAEAVGKFTTFGDNCKLDLGKGSKPSVTLNSNGGTANFAGDVAIGDSNVTFNNLGDAVALLPASITEQFETIISSLPVAQPFTGDPTTLPADIPTPLKDALVRVTTAGKINLNADDGSASFGGSISSGSSIYSQAPNSSSYNFQAKDSAGDAYFAVRSTSTNNGEVLIGGTLAPFAPNITLKRDGSITAAGNVSLEGSGAYLLVKRTGATGSTTLAQWGTDTTPQAIEFKADGSASFAGVLATNNRLICNLDGSKANVDDTFISFQEDGITSGVSFTGGGNASFAGFVDVSDYINCDRQASGDEFGLQVKINNQAKFIAKGSGSYIGTDLTNANAVIGGANISLLADGTITAKGYSMASLAQL